MPSWPNPPHHHHLNNNKETTDQNATAYGDHGSGRTFLSLSQSHALIHQYPSGIGRRASQPHSSALPISNRILWIFNSFYISQTPANRECQNKEAICRAPLSLPAAVRLAPPHLSRHAFPTPRQPVALGAAVQRQNWGLTALFD